VTLAILNSMMHGVKKYRLEPKSRGENGKMLVELTRLPVPDNFEVQDQAFVRLPAGAVGGNHRHSCAEAFICSDPAIELHWLDADGGKHIETFTETDDIFLIVVPSLVPHAVYNPTDHSIMLLEYRDAPLQDPQPMQVIQV
jgi:hypothetical protein